MKPLGEMSLKNERGFLMVEFCIFLGIWIFLLYFCLLIAQGGYHRIQNRMLIRFFHTHSFRNPNAVLSKIELNAFFFQKPMDLTFPNHETSILKINEILCTPLTLTHEAHTWRPPF